MNAIAIEKTMTIREVADALGLTPRTIQLKVKELFPGLVRERNTTYLNETQVTMVKMACEKKFAVATELEEDLLIQKAITLQAKRIKRLTDQVAAMQPKAAFYDQVTGSSNLLDIGRAAKVLNLGIGRTKLFEFLRNEKVLMVNNVPYQTYIDRGYFRVVESSYTKPDGSNHIYVKTLVYQKGLEYIRKLYIKQQ